MLSEPAVIGHEDLSRDQLLLDRGLHYGDGLFETIAAVQGEMPLLEWHLQRLISDAKRLFGRFPDDLLMQRLEKIRSILKIHPQPAVVKLLLTRGISGRGYSFEINTPLHLFAYIYPYSPMSPTQRRQGITVVNCQHRLAGRGDLGSMKHCNRLDQVFARAEVMLHQAQEGFMFSPDDFLIEATSANVVVKLDGQWFTPDVSHIGVAGVGRHLLLEQETVKIRNIRMRELRQAEAMATINSVQGVVPISVWSELKLSASPDTVISELGAGLPEFMSGNW